MMSRRKKQVKKCSVCRIPVTQHDGPTGTRCKQNNAPGMETTVGHRLTEKTFLQPSMEVQPPFTIHRSLLVAESTRRPQRHPAHGPDIQISPFLGPGLPPRFIKDVSPGQMTRIIRINTTIPSRKWCNRHVQVHSLLPLVVRHIR